MQPRNTPAQHAEKAKPGPGARRACGLLPAPQSPSEPLALSAQAASFPLLCFQTSCQKQKLSVEILTESNKYVRAEGRRNEGFLSIVKSRYR